MLSLLRLPGVELLGIAPDWLLIWVVTWSAKRSVWQAAIAGVALGWIQDGMVISAPSHVFSLVAVGVITASLNKSKYLGEDFISAAIIIFIMTLISETIFTIQYISHYFASLSDIWQNYQRITLTSAIITSLWSPAIYFPLSHWWQQNKVHNL